MAVVMFLQVPASPQVSHAVVQTVSPKVVKYPVRITDAHGNFISITYRNNQGPNIETIVDTLGRVIRFHYDWSGLLTAITVPGLGGGERVAVRLQYQWLTLSNAGPNYVFAGWLTTKVRQNTIP